MAKVIFGNHAAVLVPRQDREGIRKFYCDVLGGKITKADPERDFLRLGENFFIAFLYGDAPDESEFRRTGWKSNPTTSRRWDNEYSNPASSGSSIYPTPTFTSRRQVVRCSA
jgi:hypothetical protein